MYACECSCPDVAPPMAKIKKRKEKKNTKKEKKKKKRVRLIADTM